MKLKECTRAVRSLTEHYSHSSVSVRHACTQWTVLATLTGLAEVGSLWARMMNVWCTAQVSVCGIPEWHLQCTYQKQRLWHQYIEPHQHMCLHRELSQLSSNTDASVLGNLKGYVAVSHCKPGYKATCSYRLYCSLSRQAPTSPARNAFAACCLLQSNIDQVRCPKQVVEGQQRGTSRQRDGG